MLEPMYPRFNNLIDVVMRNLLPEGFDRTWNSDLCDTWDKIASHYLVTGRVLVWTGASDNTIFGNPEYNLKFRAWHDYVHIVCTKPFTPEGEHDVQEIQKAHVDSFGSDWFSLEEKNLFKALLEAEIDEQVKHYRLHGEFVVDQRAFTKDYMKRRYG